MDVHHMEYQDLRSKFRGALLEAAIGDALGAPFEGLPHVAASALEDLVREPGALRYTDDTHMTLGVARSLAFLRCPGSFVEVVTYAISLGGDTDTIASMAGALAGAYLGEQAIPPRWREGVEGADELTRLADELLQMTGGRIHVRPRSAAGGV